MTKLEFLSALKSGLSGLPNKEIDERLNFYSEIIDDRTEDGLSEEDAIKELGDTKEIISQIISDFPISKLIKEKIAPKKRLTVLEIVLLVLGSPIWISLIMVLLAIILSLYLSLWSVIISIWAVFVSVIASGFALVFSGIFFIFIGHSLSGIALIGAGITAIGLSVFLYLGSKLSTKGILYLTKKSFIYLKNCFLKKEEA